MDSIPKYYNSASYLREYKSLLRVIWVISIIEVIGTTYQEVFLTILLIHNKTQQHKNIVKFTKTMKEDFTRKLSQIHKISNFNLSESWNFKSHVS